MSGAGAILAIETSQRIGSVALASHAGEIDHELLRTTSRHEDDLMPAIDRLSRRCAIEPKHLTAVGVSIGPGGFTGLRIAVSTAKMLAESLRVALVAVPGSLVAAEPIEHDGPMLVCLATKRDATWVTRVERVRKHWHITGIPGLATADDLAMDDIKLVLADEHLPDTARARIESAGCAVVPPTFDARACLAVAARMLSRGETTSSLSLSPIYARPPEAVTLWEKNSRGAGKPA